jgi:hypothetical protein
MSEEPKRNSRWRKIGCDSGRVIRVLGVVEGYVVARYKGAMPWLEHVNQWHKRFAAVERA